MTVYAARRYVEFSLLQHEEYNEELLVSELAELHIGIVCTT